MLEQCLWWLGCSVYRVASIPPALSEFITTIGGHYVLCQQEHTVTGDLPCEFVFLDSLKKLSPELECQWSEALWRSTFSSKVLWQFWKGCSLCISFLYGGTGGTLVLFHTPLSGSRKVFSVLNQFTD